MPLKRSNHADFTRQGRWPGKDKGKHAAFFTKLYPPKQTGAKPARRYRGRAIRVDPAN
jgi:hypothetical protein